MLLLADQVYGFSKLIDFLIIRRSLSESLDSISGSVLELVSGCPFWRFCPVSGSKETK